MVLRVSFRRDILRKVGYPLFASAEFDAVVNGVLAEAPGDQLLADQGADNAPDWGIVVEPLPPMPRRARCFRGTPW